MAFVPVPKDLNRVKTKVMFNLTKRQLICFALAAAVGVPVYFLTKPGLGISTAAMLMVVIMLPFIFFALYEKDGQPAEKILGHVIKSMFLRDKVRPYRTNNLYAVIQQEIKEQEELQIEQQNSKGKSYADDTDQNLPVTEATQPGDTPETTPETEPDTTPETIITGEPLEDEGNAYTRDLLYDKATNKQFITIQTKNGNTFYIVIDYDAPINDEEEQYQTYFLNMVDESDLLALMDEDTVASLTTCVCDAHCEAGAVNVECPVCKTNMSECTGKVPEPETPVEDDDEQPVEEPKSGSNMGMIIAIVAIAGVGGAAYYYFKFIRGKKNKDEDLDFYDDEGYEEEPYVNEDAEPDIAEDDEEDSEDE